MQGQFYREILMGSRVGALNKGGAGKTSHFQAWSPHMVKNIQLLEKVQQRTTLCVIGLKIKTYQQRLKILGIPSLGDRRNIEEI